MYLSNFALQGISRRHQLVTSIPVFPWRMGPPDSPPSVAHLVQNWRSSRVSLTMLSMLCWAWTSTPMSGASHGVMTSPPPHTQINCWIILYSGLKESIQTHKESKVKFILCNQTGIKEHFSTASCLLLLLFWEESGSCRSSNRLI